MECLLNNVSYPSSPRVLHNTIRVNTKQMTKSSQLFDECSLPLLTTMPPLPSLPKQNKSSDFCAPLTSFDWNKTDPNLIGTSSIDTTVTIWDVTASKAIGEVKPTAVTGEVRTQLIAHDQEVYDIAWAKVRYVAPPTPCPRILSRQWPCLAMQAHFPWSFIVDKWHYPYGVFFSICRESISSHRLEQTAL
jgi:hypothetical protein